METHHVTTVAKKRDMAGTSKEHEHEDKELMEFEDFQRYKENSSG